jgi:hypothetical protein
VALLRFWFCRWGSAGGCAPFFLLRFFLWCPICGSRLIGLLLSDQASAEEQLQKAVAIAREQSAKSLELRATTSLARLWRDQGKTVEARELLAPVYGWFTEGFDTRDLKEAKALLDELERHRALKSNDDCDLLWRYSEQVGRLCSAESVGA